MKRRMSHSIIQMLTCSLVAIIISITIVEGKAMSKEERVILHFVTPFSIETYIPITMGSIENDAHKVWIMKEHGVVTDLLRTFQSTKTLKSINEKAIRLKADFGSREGIFFLDRNGIVLRKNDGQHFEMSEQQLMHAEHVLQELVGVVDVKAYNRFRSGE